MKRYADMPGGGFTLDPGGNWVEWAAARDKLVLAEEELQACETDLKLTQGGLRDALERADILTDTVEDQGAVIGTLQREICQWQVRYAELEAWLVAKRDALDPEKLVYLTGPGDHCERLTPVEPMVAVTPGGDTP